MSMDKMIPLMLDGIKDTLYMTTVSTLFAYLLGLPIAILLVLTAPSGLKPQKLVYRLLDMIVNIFRSIPFLILMILVIPVTRAIAGKAYGSTATIVPLVIAAAPYVARMIESSLLEVDPGVIEAAQSMGATPAQIIWKVLLPESMSSIVAQLTTVIISLVGESAMAGAVGGGGLGDLATATSASARKSCWPPSSSSSYSSSSSSSSATRLPSAWTRDKKGGIHMKKVLALIAALVVATLAFAGCGGSQSPSSSSSSSAAQTSGTKTLKVGATSVPHAEILEAAKPLLEKEGIKLDIVEFNDYVQPNLALNDKELDANFFQHDPYLQNFMEEHKEVKLVSAGGVHIEPMGIYSKKVKDLKDLKEGATISIPNDPTNGGRALLLLQKAGLLKLKDGVNEKATLQDIAENPKNFKFQEVEAAQVPRTLDDVDAAIINSNFAMQVQLDPTKDSLFIEDSTSPYVNIVAVRQGDENRPEIQALMKVLHSQEIKDFINNKYKGAVVPAF